MDKKDIYEHLANIYLDASQKKKKKRIGERKYKIIVTIGVAVIALSGAFFVGFLFKNKNTFSRNALVLQTEPIKLNFNFDPAKKENYSFELKGLNLSKYNRLEFSVKKENFFDDIALRIEIANSFRETSEIYLKNLPHKWQEFVIPFSDFKTISDWSEIKTIAFVIEEWNTKEKKGIVLIDNLRLVK